MVLIGVLGVGFSGDGTAKDDRPSAGNEEVSQYVRMTDGVDLAITVFMKIGAEDSQRAPTIAEFTRYGRRTVETESTRDTWRRAGFNYVAVDTRGSGVSFGSRDAEVSPMERLDIGHMIDWITAQSWSNGRVVVTGLSYDADTAEMATATGSAALAGALIRHSEFNVYKDIVFPGGVAAKVGIDLWGAYTHERDIAEECLADVQRCHENSALAAVDGDTDWSLARLAVAGHQKNARADVDFGSITFADDYFPSGIAANAIGASAVAEEIEARGVPAQVWASWVDAGTAASALERFSAFPKTATEVYIAAWTHGGTHAADPFFEDGGRGALGPAEQFHRQLDFLGRVARGAFKTRVIHYVPLNSLQWRDTEQWPPSDVRSTTWYLSDHGRLTTKQQASPSEDHWKVDYSATTGQHNRWRGNFFSGPINYGDRAQADNGLAHFDTPALRQDMEVAGDVTVTLSVRVDRSDAALFVYLEDVAPDGRSTYLTEGQVRLMHRKTNASCAHSFAKADALPVVPGETLRVPICLQPIAAHLEKGHRMRIAIAGADADTFARYPSSGALNVDLIEGGTAASSVSVASRSWK
jgi:hypothetical protein